MVNTIEEKELLKELNKVHELLETLKVTRDIVVKMDQVTQLEVILNKIKTVYPTVKFPAKLSTGCGGCIYDFLMSLIPVYDRLKVQEANEKVDGTNVFNDLAEKLETTFERMIELNKKHESAVIDIVDIKNEIVIDGDDLPDEVLPVIVEPDVVPEKKVVKPKGRSNRKK